MYYVRGDVCNVVDVLCGFDCFGCKYCDIEIMVIKYVVNLIVCICGFVCINDVFVDVIKDWEVMIYVVEG